MLKNRAILIIFVLLLSSCTIHNKDSLSRKIGDKIEESEEKNSIKTDKNCFLLLYASEEYSLSYLVSIQVKNDNYNVLDVVKLDDYYTSVDQNAENLTQIVINRNTTRDKSIIVEIKDSDILEFIGSDYIETINTTEYGYSQSGFKSLKDSLIASNYFCYFNYDSESDIQLDEVVLDVIDFIGLDYIKENIYPYNKE